MASVSNNTQKNIIFLYYYESRPSHQVLWACNSCRYIIKYYINFVADKRKHIKSRVVRNYCPYDENTTLYTKYVVIVSSRRYCVFRHFIDFTSRPTRKYCSHYKLLGRLYLSFLST